MTSRDKGKLYRSIIKITSSKTVVKDIPYTLRVPSIYYLKSIALHKNANFERISFSLNRSSVS